MDGGKGTGGMREGGWYDGVGGGRGIGKRIIKLRVSDWRSSLELVHRGETRG